MFGRRARAGRASILTLIVGAGSVALLSAASGYVLSAATAQAPAAAAPSASTTRAVLDRYCVTCHNERVVRGEREPPSVLVSQLRRAGVTLDTVDVTDPGANADVWERVILKLRTGSMPPAGRPRPAAATYRAVASWLETEIDRAAAARPNPGRTHTVHRLNRTEYRNAIRDLFALDIDVAALLPGDETSDTGFDNNADVLSITTAQLERYMSAARKITRLATGLPPPVPEFETFDVPLLLVQDDRQNEDLDRSDGDNAFFRAAATLCAITFQVDGEYLVKVRLQANWQDYIRGTAGDQVHQLDIRVDGGMPWDDLNGDDIAQGELGCTYPTAGVCEFDTSLLPANFGEAVLSRPDPEIERSWNLLTTVGVDHELGPGVSVSGSFVRRSFYDLTESTNLLRSLADYTPVTIVNPINGLPITVYNLNSRSLLALEDNFDTNAITELPAGHPYVGLDRSQVYTGLDFTVNGRLPAGATVFGGWTVQRTTSVDCDSLDDPNTFSFCNRGELLDVESGVAIDMPFRHVFKMSGNVPLPYGRRFRRVVSGVSRVRKSHLGDVRGPAQLDHQSQHALPESRDHGAHRGCRLRRV